MRRFVRLVSVAFLVVAGCSDSGGKPLLVDVAWQLTCTGTAFNVCLPAMVNGMHRWDYVADDGEEVFDESGATPVSLGFVDASCEAFEVTDGTLQIAMHAALGGESIRIEGLRVDRATGAYVPGNCRVTAYDGQSTFGGSSLGVCSDAAPATGNPCQVTNVTVDPDASGGPSIELRLFCSGLPNLSAPDSQVSIRDSADATAPAIIRFANCGGL